LTFWRSRVDPLTEVEHQLCAAESASKSEKRERVPVLVTLGVAAE
jgi:hypothetical protein